MRYSIDLLRPRILPNQRFVLHLEFSTSSYLRKFPAPSKYTTTLTSTTMTKNLVESAKREAAQEAVKKHFDPIFTHVGIGSGTTIQYVVDAIADKLKSFHKQSSSTNPNQSGTPSLSNHARRPSVVSGSEYGIVFVPTGYASQKAIVAAGLQAITLDQLPNNVWLDVAFDGADEVDAELNCIKGGGACLFQEKLVVQRARKFVCVADYRKARENLLTGWKAIPIEVAPIAANSVLTALKSLGSSDPKVRQHEDEKAGPLKTEQGFYILDAPFDNPLLLATQNGDGNGLEGSWKVDKLARAIRNITGVLEVGLFSGYDGITATSKGYQVGGQKPIIAYFGMEDGSVQTRVRQQ